MSVGVETKGQSVSVPEECEEGSETGMTEQQVIPFDEVTITFIQTLIPFSLI